MTDHLRCNKLTAMNLGSVTKYGIIRSKEEEKIKRCKRFRLVSVIFRYTVIFIVFCNVIDFSAEFVFF